MAQLMMDLPVIIIIIINCSDTEKPNFQKKDFKLNPSVSLLSRRLTAYLKKKTASSSKSESQIWLGSFRKK